MLKFIWQLPQNILGLILRKLYRAEKSTLYNHTVYTWKLNSGISLGSTIMVNKNASKNTVLHESGHQKQSLYLGWLYLIVIGLPSICWASLRKLGFFKNKSYYDFYTEKWADKLGKVNR